MNHDRRVFADAGKLRFRLLAGLAPAVVAIGLTPMLAQAQEQAVTIVLAAEPGTLDPCEAMSNDVGPVTLHNVVETLIQRDKETGELVAHLATSWEQVDELTWRFSLQDGVTFEPSPPMNANKMMPVANEVVLGVFSAPLLSDFLQINQAPDLGTSL